MSITPHPMVHSRNKFTVATIFILAAFAISSPTSAADKEASIKPNILFIFADDMGYGDLGYTGSTQVKTPNLDRLADRAVVFNQAYVTAPFCGPSRAGLLTGRYQQRFGFEFNPNGSPHLKGEWIGLPVEEKTIGDRMQAIGYHTGVIGKWHLGGHDSFYPTRRGFDYFFGMRGGGHSYFPTLEPKEKGWYKRFTLERMGRKLDKIEVPYLTDWFTEDALKYIDRQSEEGKPWFLYLSYNCPHGPLEAKEEDIAKYSHIQKKGRRIYCAMLDNLDQNVGKLVAKLKDTGQYDNTVIIFLNDNGGSVETVHALNAPFWGTKGTFYEGGIRVPMFIHYPKKLKPAKFNRAVSSLDVLPTCIAFGDGKALKKSENLGRKKKILIDGVDLLPYMLGEKGDERPHEKLYWRVMFRGNAMLDGDWKYIQTPHDLPQLYNIAEDPTEQNNLAEKHPKILAGLMDQHFKWCTTFERSPMWMDAPFWLDFNSNIHRKQFQLKQP